MRAHQWERAHELTLTILAPDFILKNKTSELEEILRDLDDHADDVKGWQLGASIYYDYLLITTQLRNCLTALGVSNNVSCDKTLANTV